MKPGDRIRLGERGHVVTFLRFGVENRRDEHGRWHLCEVAFLQGDSHGFMATLPVAFLEDAEVVR